MERTQRKEGKQANRKDERRDGRYEGSDVGRNEKKEGKKARECHEKRKKEEGRGGADDEGQRNKNRKNERKNDMCDVHDHGTCTNCKMLTSPVSKTLSSTIFRRRCQRGSTAGQRFCATARAGVN